MLILAGCGGGDNGTTSTATEPSATATAKTPGSTAGAGVTAPTHTSATGTGTEPTATGPAIQGSGASSGVKTNAPRPVLLAAQAAWVKAKARGVDMATGPCISESLPGYPDWVADVSHSPRTAVDDDPANQCQRFRSGQAHHFVELTPKGNLIRAK